jgi:hypothetical protein
MRRAPHPSVPYLEPVAGAAWWTVGTAALDAGTGTVVLAAGLGAAAGLVLALRKRYGSGAPLPRGGRTRLLVQIGVTAALIAVAGAGLGYFGWGELAVPAACAIVGAALVPLSTQLDERTFVALGGALMVLGAAGVLLALNSAGRLYPQGVVGLLAGALFWLASAHRTGLLAEARDRARH